MFSSQLCKQYVAEPGHKPTRGNSFGIKFQYRTLRRTRGYGHARGNLGGGGGLLKKKSSLRGNKCIQIQLGKEILVRVSRNFAPGVMRLYSDIGQLLSFISRYDKEIIQLTTCQLCSQWTIVLLYLLKCELVSTSILINSIISNKVVNQNKIS